MEAQFQANINWLHQEIDKIKDPEFLKKVTQLVMQRPSLKNTQGKESIIAYTVNGEPLTQERYNERLKQADKQITLGQTISQEELEKEVKNW